MLLGPVRTCGDFKSENPVQVRPEQFSQNRLQDWEEGGGDFLFLINNQHQGSLHNKEDEGGGDHGQVIHEEEEQGENPGLGQELYHQLPCQEGRQEEPGGQ